MRILAHALPGLAAMAITHAAEAQESRFESAQIGGWRLSCSRNPVTDFPACSRASDILDAQKRKVGWLTIERRPDDTWQVLIFRTKIRDRHGSFRIDDDRSYQLSCSGVACSFTYPSGASGAAKLGSARRLLADIDGEILTADIEKLGEAIAEFDRMKARWPERPLK